jgi:aspartate aminotransferase
MSERVPKALARLRPVAKESEKSPIREMLKRMEEGADIRSLAFGEANFDPPQELLELAAKAMQGNKNLYTSTNGIPLIRQAIAEFARNWWQADIDPDQNILLTVGGMEAIYLASRVLLEKGDRVLLPDPGWGILKILMGRQGAEVDAYPLVERDRWIIEPEAVVERIDDRTKLIVVNTPSNPTGATLSAEGFSRLLEAADRKGIFVLADEVYHNYIYDGQHASGLAHNHLDNLVVVNSFSKTFAITGWRLGYAVSNPWIIRQMGILKESISLCSFSIGQWALGEYLPSSATYLNGVREFCRQNMIQVVSRLQDIPGVKCTAPVGGFYVLPDFSRIEPSSQRLFERLLDGGVAVIPGDFFGREGAGRARIGFAAPMEKLTAGIDRLEDVLRNY